MHVFNGASEAILRSNDPAYATILRLVLGFVYISV